MAAILATSAVFGATAIGWNGVMLSEVARLAPANRVGAITGASGFVTFGGVMIGPPSFALIAALTGGYRYGFATFGSLAVGCGVWLLAAAYKVSAYRMCRSRRCNIQFRSCQPILEATICAEVHRMDNIPDLDPQETQEWLAALDGVLAAEGPDRAHFLIEALIDKARRSGAYLPFSANTAYINTIPVDKQVKLPGDFNIEQKIRHVRALERDGDGARARTRTRTSAATSRASRPRRCSTTSASTTSGTRRPTDHGGDLVFVQGHSAPGVYARAFMLGPASPPSRWTTSARRSTATASRRIRIPWLMPDFWQFPTVSMGLGPLMAIYQARFMKYLQDRGLATTEGRKVWCFCGDGEMDEPESMGAIGMAGARERSTT